MTRPRAASVLLRALLRTSPAMLVACPPATVPPDDGEPEPEPVVDAGSNPEPSWRCEPTGLAFDDLSWIAASTSAAAAIDLNDPELGAALQRLAEHTQSPGHGLPIPVAFSLGQWSWQVPVLRATLAQAGFDPGQLLWIAGPDADHAWVWRSACDVDLAIEHLEAAWRVAHRRVVEGVVATSGPGPADAPRFPYDVLLLTGERVALVPAGRASAVLQRWSRPAAAGLGLGAAPPSLGATLEQIPPAPVRLVLSGRALLDPGAGEIAEDVRTLSVTPQQVVGASLGDP